MKSLTKAAALAIALTFAMPPAADLFAGAGNMVSASVAHAGAYSVGLHVKTPFIKGRLVCAINTNIFMRKIGKRQTHSAAAISFLRFPRVARSHARFGDVRYNRRRGGGHVQPVLGWRHGVLMCQNPSGRRGWVVKPCPAGGVFVRP